MVWHKFTRYNGPQCVISRSRHVCHIFFVLKPCRGVVTQLRDVELWNEDAEQVA